MYQTDRIVTELESLPPPKTLRQGIVRLAKLGELAVNLVGLQNRGGWRKCQLETTYVADPACYNKADDAFLKAGIVDYQWIISAEDGYPDLRIA